MVVMNALIPFTLILCARKGVSLTRRELAAFSTAVEIQDADDSDTYVLISNGMPEYESDGNFGNRTVSPQSYQSLIPKNPQDADEASCTPPGYIGFAVDGVPFFNPYTSLCCDAGELEQFDSCNGHPTGTNAYHYHMNPTCLDEPGTSKFLGVALDGYPIYNGWHRDGTLVQQHELDSCGGMLTRNGKYRYIITDEFPYIIGCFKGSIADESALRKIRGGCQCTQVDTDACQPIP